MPAPAEKSPVPPPQPYAPLPALLSYLVPGLGQIVQGRVAKGLLFMVCLYTLFFYGLFLGRGQAAVPSAGSGKLEEYRVSSNVYLPTAKDRDQAGNQANNPFNLPDFVLDVYHRPQFLGQFWMGAVVWPAVWQYATYDKAHNDKGHWLLGKFMRTPTVEELNAIHTTSDKNIDLGWVCTVIAGVLNILVIYDALAGPAYPPPTQLHPSPLPAT
jgi:hypothetical protein